MGEALSRDSELAAPHWRHPAKMNGSAAPHFLKLRWAWCSRCSRALLDSFPSITISISFKAFQHSFGLLILPSRRQALECECAVRDASFTLCCCDPGGWDEGPCDVCEFVCGQLSDCCISTLLGGLILRSEQAEVLTVL